MELKLAGCYACDCARIAFNRTYLELKRNVERAGNRANSSFNRTYLELKRIGSVAIATDGGAFNRTYLELKLPPPVLPPPPTGLLIAPIWN